MIQTACIEQHMYSLFLVSTYCHCSCFHIMHFCFCVFFPPSVCSMDTSLSAVCLCKGSCTSCGPWPPTKRNIWLCIQTRMSAGRAFSTVGAILYTYCSGIHPILDELLYCITAAHLIWFYCKWCNSQTKLKAAIVFQKGTFPKLVMDNHHLKGYWLLLIVSVPTYCRCCHTIQWSLSVIIRTINMTWVPVGRYHAKSSARLLLSRLK